MTVLVVSGSRALYTHEWGSVERPLVALIRGRGVLELYHGAAAGVDRFAARIAQEQGIGVRAFPADWNRYGRSAGMRRNGEMLTAARVAGSDLVIAFPRPGGRGTQGMIAEATARGFEVIVHRVLA